MLALLKGVPVISHPVFRVVLGAVLIAAGVAVLYDAIILIAPGALLLVMGLARGYTAVTQKTTAQ